MKKFKEWLSDNLRYLMLIAAILLGICAIILIMRLVSGTGNRQEEAIVLLTEAPEEAVATEAQEALSEEATEAITEGVTEEVTEAITETVTEEVTEARTQETQTDTETESETSSAERTQSETQAETAADIIIVDETQAETTTSGDTAASTTQTEAQTEEMDTLRMMASTTKYASTEANVRSGPGTSYGIIGGLSTGESITVTGETTNWYRIETDEGIGYVSKSLVVDEYTPTYATISSACYLRSEAGYYDANGADTVITQLEAGTVVEVISDEGWAHVRVNGLDGYVGSKFLRY